MNNFIAFFTYYAYGAQLVTIIPQACQYLTYDDSYYSLGTQENAQFQSDGSNLKITYTGGTDDRYRHNNSIQKDTFDSIKPFIK